MIHIFDIFSILSDVSDKILFIVVEVIKSKTKGD